MLNMDLDLQYLFELHVHRCTRCLRPRNPLPGIWAHMRGRAKIDAAASLCDPLVAPVSLEIFFGSNEMVFAHVSLSHENEWRNLPVRQLLAKIWVVGIEQGLPDPNKTTETILTITVWGYSQSRVTEDHRGR
jgi:hypothetical protein